MEQALENNEVLLWGEKLVNKDLLKEYDKGNKNPYSVIRKKTDKKEVEVIKENKPPKKRIFEVGGDYGIQDLPFLNDEYERLDKEMSDIKDFDKLDELMDLQEKLSDLIEGLEHFKKISGGKGIKQSNNNSSQNNNQTNNSNNQTNNSNQSNNNNNQSNNQSNNNSSILNKLIGQGFKKGSPEAIAHAEKMRKALEAKKTNTVVKKSVSSKSRIEKGSEEAKELGRRLAEARRKKKEQKDFEKTSSSKEPKPEVKKKTGKPWYYIGDIPKGYREATEDEAIENKKVSLYGKYQVDNEKWRLYRDYNILLTDEKSNQEIGWSMNGLKRRIMTSLKEIEILKSKVDSDKYKDKRTEYESKLEEEKEKRKYLQAGWNWYNKLLSSRTGKPYERQKFELPVRVFKQNKTETEVEYKPPPRPIDPRTGKEAEYFFPEEEKKEIKKLGVVDVNLLFENEKDLIELSTKYFTPDYKLKPAYAKKLLDKGIFLQKKYYTTEDYAKYFYRMKGDGISVYKQVLKK